MNWVNEGSKAARQAPNRWEEIRDMIFREVSAKRDKNTKRLEYEGHLCKQQEQQLIAELNATAAKPLSMLRHFYMPSVLLGSFGPVTSRFHWLPPSCLTFNAYT